MEQWVTSMGISSRLFVSLLLVAGGNLALADSPSSQPKSDVSRLPRPAAELYCDTTLFPRETKWKRIPWLIDLDQAIRLAREEKRPLLIWISGDDPLERC